MSQDEQTARPTGPPYAWQVPPLVSGVEHSPPNSLPSLALRVLYLESEVFTLRAMVNGFQQELLAMRQVSGNEHPFMRAEQVQTATCLDARTIDRLVARGEFPAPVQLSPRRRAWRTPEVSAWLAARAGTGGCPPAPP